MRRIMLLVTVVLVMAAMMLVAAGPAFASHMNDVHPFCGTGREYADEHITTLAQQQGLGPAHGHTPGLEHSGFSVCDPAGHAGSE
jgi:hypothetical protein